MKPMASGHTGLHLESEARRFIQNREKRAAKVGNLVAEILVLLAMPITRKQLADRNMLSEIIVETQKRLQEQRRRSRQASARYLPNRHIQLLRLYKKLTGIRNGIGPRTNRQRPDQTPS